LTSGWALAGSLKGNLQKTLESKIKQVPMDFCSLSASQGPRGRRCRASMCGKRKVLGSLPQGVAGGGAVCVSSGLCLKHGLYFLTFNISPDLIHLPSFFVFINFLAT